MAGIQNIGAGAGRACATRGNETGHWQGAGQNRLDDQAHRSVQPAGGVEVDDHQLRALGHRTHQAAFHVVGTGRTNSIVDGQDHDTARSRRRNRR
ncbi:hypothetical protein D9M71_187910 [compost metagenome]